MRLAVALAFAWLSTLGPAIALPPDAAAKQTPELVYVANGEAITGYPATSKGTVFPVREADDPHNPNTVWDPWSIAFDRHGDLYAQTFLSDATTFVFGPNPRRGVKPIRIFSAYGPDTRSIAIDDRGYEYIASGEAGSLIAVAAPLAAGRPQNGYSVGPVRTFPSGDATFNPWPDILTIDGAGRLLVSIAYLSGQNAIVGFTGGPNGSSTPVRAISGPHTGLGTACVETCDQVAMAYSRYTGRLYVAVSNGKLPSHISVFDGNANGDARPLRTIEGPATGLAGKVITGIADSQVTGDIYAMVKSAEFSGTGRVEVFGRLAHGNAPPLRTFTDRTTRFRNGLGIALHAG
jgi:hypothetical protein